MKRRHLFEFEDLKWFPDVFRRGTTDFLSFVFSKTNRYAPVVPLIAEAIDGDDPVRIVDLCSGGSGGIANLQRDLSELLKRKVTVTLSDKYPNLEAFEKIQQSSEGIEYEVESVDATDVPERLDGFRTIFTAFHHFKPDMAQAILRDAVEKKVPIGVFELGNKGPKAIAKLVVTVPLGLLLVTPFLKPVRASRYLFTYLLPVIPLATIWDGVVSILRVYTPDQLRELTAAVDAADYEWKIGTAVHAEGVGKGEVIYLIGRPVK
ncbi:hypothetical protein ABT127_20570 [Streptomyces sp. NPDC001904]|uniref:hypothetical protein n=1 Tax=Streptomyces sp. NPDC001904 TaxID=3154531 RepID=UPI00332C696C